jgi:hypothetical protein
MRVATPFLKTKSENFMRLGLILISILTCGCVVFAEAPRTAPATQPVPFAADAPARNWFAELASPEDNKREEARTNLMGLTRNDLPRLRALVEQSRPLAASQVAALHEIVIQIYLSGESYPPAFPVTGFLGLSWPQGTDPGTRLGVLVQTRFPGFPSFRMLRDGDLILGVLLNPNAPLEVGPNTTTQDLGRLMGAIGAAGANREVVLDVLRQGQEIKVPLQLKPHPLLEIGADPTDFFDRRQQKAEEYWRTEFVPLLRDRSTS